MEDNFEFDVFQTVRVAFDVGLASYFFDAEITDKSADSLWLRARDRSPNLDKIPVGAKGTLEFWNGVGLHRAKNLRLIERKPPMKELEIERPYVVETVQRRAFFRVPVHRPVQIEIVRSNAGGRTSYSELKATTEDLSGGGLAVTTDVELPRDTELRLRLQLEPGQSVSALGRVRWNAPVPKRLQQRRFGIEFTQIDEETQDLVFGFLFEHQRQQRRALTSKSA